MGWTTGFRFPTEAGNFSLLHRFQAGSGAHPASYPVGTGQGLKLIAHVQLVPWLKMRGAISPLPDTTSWRGAYLSRGTSLVIYFYMAVKSRH